VPSNWPVNYLISGQNLTGVGETGPRSLFFKTKTLQALNINNRYQSNNNALNTVSYQQENNTIY